MTTQPKALALADALDEKPDSDGHCRQAATLLRAQHAEIERKDALLRQLLEELKQLVDWTPAMLDAQKELAK